MSSNNNLEIERKFLIRYPSKEVFDAIPACDRSAIVQTYLESEPGVTHRVRMRRYAEGTKYYKTEKIRRTALTCDEFEGEISEKEYAELLLTADKSRRPVEKERLLLKSGNHTFEIDIYPFWDDRAIMEVELSSEEETFSVPAGIEVIKEVSGDKRYKNAALAKEIPNDVI